MKRDGSSSHTDGFLSMAYTVRTNLKKFSTAIGVLVLVRSYLLNAFTGLEAWPNTAPATAGS